MTNQINKLVTYVTVLFDGKTVVTYVTVLNDGIMLVTYVTVLCAEHNAVTGRKL